VALGSVDRADGGRATLTRVWNGTAWLLGPDVPASSPGTPTHLDRLSCLPKRCVAVGADGAIAAYAP
jgi:hypothetical protein